jgi:hypothetical protein
VRGDSLSMFAYDAHEVALALCDSGVAIAQEARSHPSWLQLVRKAAAGRFECACRMVGTWWLMPYRTRMLARVLRWQGSRSFHESGVGCRSGRSLAKGEGGDGAPLARRRAPGFRDEDRPSV